MFVSSVAHFFVYIPPGLRELEERLQDQAAGRISSIVKSYEEQIRVLRQKVSDLDYQLSQQMSSLDAGLDELLDSKISLEKKVQEMAQDLLEKERELALYQEAATKLRTQRDLTDKKATEEKVRSQRLFAAVEKIEGEKGELLTEIELLSKQLKKEAGERTRLERELRVQQEKTQDLQTKCEKLASENLRLDQL